MLRVVLVGPIADGLHHALVVRLEVPLRHRLPRLDRNGVVRPHRRKKYYAFAAFQNESQKQFHVRRYLAEVSLVFPPGQQQLIAKFTHTVGLSVKPVGVGLSHSVVSDGQVGGTHGAGAQKVLLNGVVRVAGQERVAGRKSALCNRPEVGFDRLWVYRVDSLQFGHEPPLDLRCRRESVSFLQVQPEAYRCLALFSRSSDTPPLTPYRASGAGSPERQVHRRCFRQG